MGSLDDAYHEYLWGEESPRAFAKRMKHGQPNKSSRHAAFQVKP